MTDAVASKSKAGRKPIDEGEKRVTVSTSLKASDYAVLEEIRWTNRINTMGEVVRKALETFIATQQLSQESDPKV